MLAEILRVQVCRCTGLVHHSCDLPLLEMFAAFCEVDSQGPGIKSVVNWLICFVQAFFGSILDNAAFFDSWTLHRVRLLQVSGGILQGLVATLNLESPKDIVKQYLDVFSGEVLHGEAVGQEF